MRFPWTSGHRSFDENLGLDVLDLARGNPNTEKDLQTNLELRGAVYAIIGSLPKRVQRRITYDNKVDIASVVILQRAASYQAALKDCGVTIEPEETVDEHATDTGTDTGGAEET